MNEIRVVRHSHLLGFYLAFIALVAYFPIYLAFWKMGTEWDSRVCGTAALLVAIGGWWVAERILTQRRGVTVRFSWNTKQTVLHVILYRRFSKVDHRKLRIADYYGKEDWLGVSQIKKALFDFFRANRSVMASAGEVHLVGLSTEDAHILGRLIRRALDWEKGNGSLPKPAPVGTQEFPPNE